MIRLIQLTILAICFIADSAPGQDLKQFLNIQAPETALNAPIIFTHKGETTLVGLYYRNGKRDVSAMRFEDGKWLPLGKNGNAITGAGGNFISDVSVDKNGNPWLLTYYTRPSNSNREDRFYLYTLRDDEWVVVGPPQGHKADYSGDETLFFLDSSPVMSYYSWDLEAQSRYRRLFVMKENEWVEKPADRVFPRDSYILIHQNQPYVVHPQESRVNIFRLENIDSGEMGNPAFSIDFPANRNFSEVYFHNGRPAIIRLRDVDSDSFLFKCNQAGDKPELQELPKTDGHQLIGFYWKLNNELLIATNDFTTARVYELNAESKWNLVFSAKEPSGAVLFEPHFSLLNDGTPVVTWEAFFPH